MKVRVVHGANEARFDVAGNSVSVVRRQLRDQFTRPVSNIFPKYFPSTNRAKLTAG